MPRQVVILHGWSDTSKSFQPLASFLSAHGYQAVPIWLGDYISMEDDVAIPDVAGRMERVIRDLMGTGTLDPQFDLIVHSTGGLVAREWISGFYGSAPKNCPARRLVMLAPANFGSRLASLGQSMLGRLVKGGWKTWFHTGKRMLDALELASRYQWDLTQRDTFVPQGRDSVPPIYGAEGVWPFIICGTHPYTGTLREIINENGSDGTVRPCAANLNTRGVTIDFAVDEKTPQVTPWKLRQPNPFPFAILPDETHGSIIDPTKPEVATSSSYNRQIGDRILEALACADLATYQQMVENWNSVSEATASLRDRSKAGQVFARDEPPEYFHQYVQIVVRVRDNFGDDVADYFLEFSGPENDSSNDATRYFHGRVLEDVHVNSANSAYRCLFADRTDLMEAFYGLIRGSAEKALAMSISANPLGDRVAYFENYKVGAKGSTIVHREQQDTPESRWLKRNTTHFAEIVIPRVSDDAVFKLTRYQP